MLCPSRLLSFSIKTSLIANNRKKSESASIKRGFYWKDDIQELGQDSIWDLNKGIVRLSICSLSILHDSISNSRTKSKSPERELNASKQSIIVEAGLHGRNRASGTHPMRLQSSQQREKSLLNGRSQNKYIVTSILNLREQYGGGNTI